MRKLIGLTLAIIVSGQAFADSGKVSLSGVNMSDPEQLAKLHQIVVRTADKVCKSAGNASPSELRTCIREAVDRAVGSNPSAELKSFHNSMDNGERYRVVASN